MADEPSPPPDASTVSLTAVCISGPSDSGKTTLVERLIPLLESDGPVATVKSIHHSIEPDTPGTDTYRHRHAGAETVVGITPELTFQVTTEGKSGTDREDDRPSAWHSDDELGALYRTLESLSEDGYRYALVEGFTGAPLPSIVAAPSDDIDECDVIGSLEDDAGELVAAIRNSRPFEAR
ncbi:MAG: molybdopterin-guanine dinucleotide biosynthesis protein B [Halobacteriota archaeon]